MRIFKSYTGLDYVRITPWEVRSFGIAPTKDQPVTEIRLRKRIKDEQRDFYEAYLVEATVEEVKAWIEEYDKNDLDEE